MFYDKINVNVNVKIFSYVTFCSDLVCHWDIILLSYSKIMDYQRLLLYKAFYCLQFRAINSLIS